MTTTLCPLWELLFFYRFNPRISEVILKEQHQRDRNVPGIQTLLTQSQNYRWHSLAPYRETCWWESQAIILTKNHWSPSRKNTTGKSEEVEPEKWCTSAKILLLPLLDGHFRDRFVSTVILSSAFLMTPPHLWPQFSPSTALFTCFH